MFKITSGMLEAPAFVLLTVFIFAFYPILHIAIIPLIVIRIVYFLFNLYGQFVRDSFNGDF